MNERLHKCVNRIKSLCYEQVNEHVSVAIAELKQKKINRSQTEHKLLTTC